jgi:hypothetical protein
LPGSKRKFDGTITHGCATLTAILKSSRPYDDDPAGERVVTTYTFLMDYRVAALIVGEAERKGL